MKIRGEMKIIQNLHFAANQINVFAELLAVPDTAFQARAL